MPKTSLFSLHAQDSTHPMSLFALFRIFFANYRE